MREPGDDSDEGGSSVRKLEDVVRLRWTRLQHRGSPVGPAEFRETSWADLVDMLSTIRRTKVKEDAGAWSPATFFTRSEVEARAGCCPGGAHKLEKRCLLRGKKEAVARKAENVRAVSLLVIDVDEGGRPALDAVLQRLEGRGVRHWWHTTHTSADRFRVAVPLSEPVPAERWWDVWHWGTKALGARSSADVSCKDASRIYYLPATALDRLDDGGCGGARAGRCLDVQALYAQGPWPEQPRRSSDAPPKAYPPATPTELWAAEQALEKFGDAVEGQHGDSRTFTAAALLVNDWALTTEEAWPLLLRWNARHARPAWSEEELLEKLENSGAYAHGVYGGAREARTPYQLEVALVEAELERMLANVPRSAPAPWKPVAQLLDEEFAPTDWLIQGLVANDTLTIIGADPKASKTWTLLELALAVGTGSRAFGEFPAHAGEVLLFLNEDTERSVRNRFRALARGAGINPRALTHIHVRAREPLNLLDRTQLAQFIVDVRMAPQKPALVGLDPLRNLHSAEENSSTEMWAVLRAVGAIRALCGCALAVVHHANKKGGDGDTRTGGARLRGSSAIDAYRDGLISLEETEKSDAGDEISNTVAVDLKAARGAGRFALALHIEDDENGEAVCATWRRTDAEPRPTKPARAEREGPVITQKEQAAKDVLAYFRRLHQTAAATSGQEVWIGQGKAVDELAALIGASKPTVRRALEWLVEMQKLVREPAPARHRDARGVQPRWQLRLADDAIESPEEETGASK